MSDDWIKLRKSVLTHPRLVRTMSALNADRLRTLGGVVSAWCLLDEQTADGNLDGYTPEALDEMIGFPGLARAMAAAGWLIITENGLHAPEFQKHNGASAKRRAQENVRKMSARNADKRPQADQTFCAPEKEKEKDIPPCPPRGVARADAHAHARTSTPAPVGRLGLDDDWLRSLRENSNYAHLNVDHELGKCLAWCEANGRECNRRRFVNWLNGADTPLNPPPRDHESI